MSKENEDLKQVFSKDPTRQHIIRPGRSGYDWVAAVEHIYGQEAFPAGSKRSAGFLLRVKPTHLESCYITCNRARVDQFKEGKAYSFRIVAGGISHVAAFEKVATTVRPLTIMGRVASDPVLVAGPASVPVNEKA